MLRFEYFILFPNKLFKLFPLNFHGFDYVFKSLLGWFDILGMNLGQPLLNGIELQLSLPFYLINFFSQYGDLLISLFSLSFPLLIQLSDLPQQSLNFIIFYSN